MYGITVAAHIDKYVIQTALTGHFPVECFLLYLNYEDLAVALWDKSAPSVYLKKSDMTGRPSMVIYDLVERREQPAKQNTEQGVLYATKTDLKDVLDVVDDLKRQLDEMRLKTQNNAPEEVL